MTLYEIYGTRSSQKVKRDIEVTSEELIWEDTNAGVATRWEGQVLEEEASECIQRKLPQKCDSKLVTSRISGLTYGIIKAMKICLSVRVRF